MQNHVEYGQRRGLCREHKTTQMGSGFVESKKASVAAASSPMALTLKYFPAIFWQGKGLMNLGTGFAQA